MPIYFCMYYNVDDLHSGLCCVEMFDEQSSVWCCHLWTFFLALFWKTKTIHNHVFAAWSVVYSDAVCSSCCRCVACVESSFQKVKMLQGPIILAVLIGKCHSAYQSASNYITLSKTFCKYRICVSRIFLFLKIFIVFSMKFSYNSSGKMCSYLYSN